MTAADGTALLTRRWAVSAGTPLAHVLLVHGLGEHSGRYEHVGEHLAQARLAVYAYDHRGNGGSGGARGHVNRWSELHDDLTEHLAAVSALAAGGPVVLYGHSMGGLIVAGYCLSARPRPRPDLVVLSAPGLDSTLPAWKKRAAVMLGRVAPAFRITHGVDLAMLSRDPRVGAQLATDPLCCMSSTARFGAEGLREQGRVRRGAPRGLGVPTLVLHGESDGLVPVEATRVFEGAPQTTRWTYPGLRHELHNEPEGKAILDEVIAWIASHIGRR